MTLVFCDTEGGLFFSNEAVFDFFFILVEDFMDFTHRHVAGLKMSLNHSQSGIEEGLAEIEGDFRSWLDHPHQRTLRSHVIEHLVSFRWVLDQHFTRVAGEGYLENIVALRPGMYQELREIECRQCDVLNDLDRLIHRSQGCAFHRDTISDLFDDFQRVRAEILDEESLERSMVEKGLA